jgi:hypothetical protein
MQLNYKLLILVQAWGDYFFGVEGGGGFVFPESAAPGL